MIFLSFSSASSSWPTTTEQAAREWRRAGWSVVVRIGTDFHLTGQWTHSSCNWCRKAAEQMSHSSCIPPATGPDFSVLNPYNEPQSCPPSHSEALQRYNVKPEVAGPYKGQSRPVFAASQDFLYAYKKIYCAVLVIWIH